MNLKYTNSNFFWWKGLIAPPPPPSAPGPQVFYVWLNVHKKLVISHPINSVCWTGENAADHILEKLFGGGWWMDWPLPSSMDCTVERLFTVRGQSYFSRLPKYWPPIPLSAWRVCPPPPQQRRGYTLAGRRGGWGINILEDERDRIALLQ